MASLSTHPVAGREAVCSEEGAQPYSYPGHLGLRGRLAAKIPGLKVIIYRLGRLDFGSGKEPGGSPARDLVKDA